TDGRPRNAVRLLQGGQRGDLRADRPFAPADHVAEQAGQLDIERDAVILAESTASHHRLPSVSTTREDRRPALVRGPDAFAEIVSLEVNALFGNLALDRLAYESRAIPKQCASHRLHGDRSARGDLAGKRHCF